MIPGIEVILYARPRCETAFARTAFSKFLQRDRDQPGDWVCRRWIASIKAVYVNGYISREDAIARAAPEKLERSLCRVVLLFAFWRSV
jgi:hypothetical protein